MEANGLDQSLGIPGQMSPFSGRTIAAYAVHKSPLLGKAVWSTQATDPSAGSENPSLLPARSILQHIINSFLWPILAPFASDSNGH